MSKTERRKQKNRKLTGKGENSKPAAVAPNERAAVAQSGDARVEPTAAPRAPRKLQSIMAFISVARLPFPDIAAQIHQAIRLADALWISPDRARATDFTFTNIRMASHCGDGLVVFRLGGPRLTNFIPWETFFWLCPTGCLHPLCTRGQA